MESFLFADVYCLGFGFGLAEFDLWWLLNRKAREQNNTGNLYFYEPKNENDFAKIELLSLMKKVDGSRLVEIINLDYVKTDNTNWRKFYSECVFDIEKRIYTSLTEVLTN